MVGTRSSKRKHLGDGEEVPYSLLLPTQVVFEKRVMPLAWHDEKIVRMVVQGIAVDVVDDLVIR